MRAWSHDCVNQQSGFQEAWEERHGENAMRCCTLPVRRATARAPRMRVPRGEAETMRLHLVSQRRRLWQCGTSEIDQQPPGAASAEQRCEAGARAPPEAAPAPL